MLAIRTVCDEEVRQELGRELEALYVEQVFARIELVLKAPKNKGLMLFSKITGDNSGIFGS